MNQALLVWLILGTIPAFFLQTNLWPAFPWLPNGTNDDPLERRIQPPVGFQRLKCAERSFGIWLRALPVKPGRPDVRLFDGRRKSNQDAHYAVLDIDVGNRDLQQCADAVIRVRAEYLRSVGCEDSIQFHFTSGDLVPWARWRSGQRPVLTTNRMSWRATGQPDLSYAGFRRYLDEIFTYAGSASLERELMVVTDPARPAPGDVYVQGGSPGHAVLVADVCVNTQGERMFLLAQSYMPAQEIHILVNPGSPCSPWYPAGQLGRLITPEWIFDYRQLRRFPPDACAPDATGPAS
jgi:hypothetical protein